MTWKHHGRAFAIIALLALALFVVGAVLVGTGVVAGDTPAIHRGGRLLDIVRIPALLIVLWGLALGVFAIRRRRK